MTAQRARKEPLSIPRPGDPATDGGAHPLGVGLHENADGSMTAVGLQGMLAMAQAAGAVATHAPATGGASGGESGG